MSFLTECLRRLPLIVCVATPASMFITYGIAVGLDHVYPLLPYISETGTIPPESCVFGLLLGGISFLLCAAIYVRYRQVSEYVKLRPSVGISPAWNRAAAFFGFVSCLGLNLVANFQEGNEFITHILGALTCFFSASVYFSIQTMFTRKMHPRVKWLFWTRVVLTCLNVLFIVGTFAPVGPALKEFHDSSGKDVRKWTAKDGGYAYHLTSTFCEWLLVFSFCAYVSTLAWDFGHIRIEPFGIKFVSMPEASEAKAEEENGADGSEDAPQKAKSFWI